MRIRTVKPEFFTDPHVTQLTHTARLLYISMWTQADDRGRLEDAPRRLCANAFGDHERVNANKLVAELATGAEPRILRYDVRGKRFIAIRWFRFHQVISKPQESRLPAPPEPGTEPFQGFTRDEYRNTTGTVPGSLQDPSQWEVELGSGTGMEVELGSGMEGKGKIYAADAAPMAEGEKIKAFIADLAPPGVPNGQVYVKAPPGISDTQASFVRKLGGEDHWWPAIHKAKKRHAAAVVTTALSHIADSPPVDIANAYALLEAECQQVEATEAVAS